VNLSSAAGIRGVPNRLPYAASKYGVVGITQTMALELGPLGVRVNAVVPGMIRTPMTAPMFEDPENVQRIRAAHPIGREGQPEEVAAAITFLLSDDASFITAWLFRSMAVQLQVFGHTKSGFLPGVSISLAPLAGRGRGEGPFFEFGLKRFENPIEVIDDIVVPEADHAIPKGA
jgi:NAD(P)-dependent dehydrogenase (short-subunit alcohol dehydrogenase family)